MKLYRLLTGEGDAAFCKKVSEALNRGWELCGSPAMTFDAASGRLVAGQAVVKEVDADWEKESAREDFRLGAY
jgi:hypothetical protein